MGLCNESSIALTWALVLQFLNMFYVSIIVEVLFWVYFGGYIYRDIQLLQLLIRSGWLKGSG